MLNKNCGISYTSRIKSYKYIIYKNNVYFISLRIILGPPMEISKEEEKIWSDFSNSLTNAATTLRNLEDLRDKVMNVKLTSRTLELLSLGNNNNNTEHKSIESTKLEFIESYKEIPLSNHTLITCMEVLKKDSGK